MTQASYVHGNSAQPLIGNTIGAYFDKIVDRFGESEALVARHQNLRWTYRQLRRRVDNLASNLAWLGLEPGDRIGIWSQNNAQWLLIQLASAKAGLILVNLNPAYQRNELKYALNKVQCKALIVARGQQLLVGVLLGRCAHHRAQQLRVRLVPPNLTDRMYRADFRFVAAS